MKPLLKILTVALVAGAFSVAAFAASSARQEIATAIEHAGYAAQANQVAKVHLHLHHVVNCLVGKHGKQFYAPAGDPCKGMGRGAINDAGAHTALKARLEKVLNMAERGLSENKLKNAKASALHVKRMLKSVQGSMKK
ncbi:MAG: hypothetical protein ACRETC_03170 [Gammaproteobacteria bacterium]